MDKLGIIDIKLWNWSKTILSLNCHSN